MTTRVRCANSRPRCYARIPLRWNACAAFCNSTAKQVQIPSVLTSSEVLKREAWILARETLGCDLADYYGQAERVNFAYALELRSYRFLHSYGLVELRPFASDHLSDAGQGGLFEIVGTTFWNDLMPLVRYRTGDLVRLPDDWGAREIEEVTLGLRSFSGVLGREQTTRLPDGRAAHGYRPHSTRCESHLAHSGHPGKP